MVSVSLPSLKTSAVHIGLYIKHNVQLMCVCFQFNHLLLEYIKITVINIIFYLLFLTCTICKTVYIHHNSFGFYLFIYFYILPSKSVFFLNNQTLFSVFVPIYHQVIYNYNLNYKMCLFSVVQKLKINKKNPKTDMKNQTACFHNLIYIVK